MHKNREIKGKKGSKKEGNINVPKKNTPIQVF
jgi:hypothetical protein